MTRRITGRLTGGVMAGVLVLGGVGTVLAGGRHGPLSPTSRSNAARRTATPGGAGGMMGGAGGMMGGAGGMMGQMGGPIQITSPTAARALSQRVAATATVDRQTHTITYHASQVELVALASPDGGPNMTWTVDDLVNPTVVIPTGAHVTVNFFDADTGTIHGWELTSTPPPYPYMAMMDAPVAFSGAFAMPVSGATGQRWVGRTVQFTASSAGVYDYICPVPGHAEKGMHGTVVVR